jgi:tripartite-type tricarboxylate transporter receptor subunit TctC
MPIRLQPTRRGFLQASAAACAWPLLARSAGPAPLRVIVPFAPGGPSDVVLRAVAARWSERTAQPLIIEHKPGAAGSIGAELARRAEPDGQTLLFAPADVLVNNTATFPELPYDPLRDFKPLVLIGPVPLLLVVPSGIGVRTLADFQAWAKGRRIGYGSWGEGSHAHLLAESLLVRQLHLDAVHAPYRGLAPMLQDLIGGQLNAGFAVPPAAAPHVTTGRLQALAVSGERRSVALPNAPTLRELGFDQPVFQLRQWAAFMAPASTPPATLMRLEHDLTAALDDPSVRQALQGAGFEIERVLGAADAASTLRADLALIPPLIRALGVTPQ